MGASQFIDDSISSSWNLNRADQQRGNLPKASVNVIVDDVIDSMVISISIVIVNMIVIDFDFDFDFDVAVCLHFVLVRPVPPTLVEREHVAGCDYDYDYDYDCDFVSVRESVSVNVNRSDAVNATVKVNVSVIAIVIGKVMMTVSVIVHGNSFVVVLRPSVVECVEHRVSVLHCFVVKSVLNRLDCGRHCYHYRSRAYVVRPLGVASQARAHTPSTSLSASCDRASATASTHPAR